MKTQPNEHTPHGVQELEGALMERDTPIVDFAIRGGLLVWMKEYPENGKAYSDLWTPGELSHKELMDFFAHRIPVWHRPSVQRMCKRIGVNPGNADQYFHATHGVSGDDYFWIRFPGEDIRWDDLKIRE